MSERVGKNIEVRAPEGEQVADRRTTFQRVLERMVAEDTGRRDEVDDGHFQADISERRAEIVALPNMPIDATDEEALLLARVKAIRNRRKTSGQIYEDAISVISKAGDEANAILQAEILESLRKVG